MALSPYRCDAPQCSVCGTTLDPAECLLSFTGQLICDHCFVTQTRPPAELQASDETQHFEPPLRRRALWAHAFLRVLLPGGLLVGAGLLAAERSLASLSLARWLLAALGVVVALGLARRATSHATARYVRGS